jgi:Serine dehydrogenase proteinase
MARNDRIELIRRIEAHRGSRVICCLTSDRPNAAGMIAKDFIPIFFNHLDAFPEPERRKIDVLMLTNGGDTLAAFGLGRLIREFTDEVGVLIPEKCQSAGTLFALGANEIVMGKVATLTPIDPSVNSPLGPVVEIGPGQRQSVPVSVESVAGYRNLLKQEWGLKGQGLGLAFRMLAEKINPLVLGDVYRSRQQIEKLAKTLLNCHRTDERNIQSIVEKLTRGLGSHDYLISRREARELLGKQVAGDDPALETLMWELYKDFASEMKLGQLFDIQMVIHASTAAGQALPVTDEQRIVLVESTIAGDRFERAMLLSRNPVMTPAGPVQVPQAVLVRAGWTHYD